MGRHLQVRKLLVSMPLLAASGLALAQNRNLTVELEPAFSDFRATGYSRFLVPVRVTLRNAGPDAVGRLTVNSGEYRMDYPVELPGGGVKRFIAYSPSSLYYGQTVFNLETDRGWTEERFEVPVDPESMYKPILLVSDVPGLMVFMRGSTQRTGDRNLANPRDVYAAPGDLPDRACGFSTLRAVVLGEGAERLTDPEIRALQTWVIAGGTLVMLGGASSPVLSDPRWADFAPIRGAKAATMSASAVLSKLGRSNVPAATMAVMKGTLAQGCTGVMDGGTPIVAVRPVGLGKVVFFAFNPFEEPLKRWPGRTRLFTSQTGASFGATAFDLASSGQSEGMGRYAVPPGSYPYSPRGGYGDDPFNVKLPPVSSVVWILLGYLVLVVPVNLLILKKLGRSEWAWGTTPVISLVFAGVFFGFAGNLYSAKMSIANTGVLVLDSRFDTAYYVGDSQMFFPRGGVYDLGLKTTEAASSGSGEPDYYNRGRRSSTSLNAVDVGEVRVERMRVNNLSFVELNYLQQVQASKWIEANLQVTEDGTGFHATGTVTNRSPYTITGKLICGSYGGMLPALGPGKVVRVDGLTLTVQQPLRPNPLEPLNGPGPGYAGPRYNGDQPVQIDLVAGTPRRVLIDGNIVGFRPGPQLGEAVERGSSVRFIAILGDVEAPKAQ